MSTNNPIEHNVEIHVSRTGGRWAYRGGKVYLKLYFTTRTVVIRSFERTSSQNHFSLSPARERALQTRKNESFSVDQYVSFIPALSHTGVSRTMKKKVLDSGVRPQIHRRARMAHELSSASFLVLDGEKIPEACTDAIVGIHTRDNVKQGRRSVFGEDDTVDTPKLGVIRIRKNILWPLARMGISDKTR